jgi:hypothetical protein
MMKVDVIRKLGQTNVAELERQIGILHNIAKRESEFHEHYNELAVQVNKNTELIASQKAIWETLNEEGKRREKVRRDVAVRVKDILRTGKQLAEQLEQETAAESALLPLIQKLSDAYGGSQS